MLSGKPFELSVQILLVKADCPGVWMCRSGPVSMSIATMGRKMYSAKHTPKFPLFFSQNFSFQKHFKSIQDLSNELIYCELIQWTYGYRRILASYVGVLDDLICSGVNNDNKIIKLGLLMNAVNSFPGIIAPIIDINISANTTRVSYKKKGPLRIKNRLITPYSDRNSPIRQKPVCHSMCQPFSSPGSNHVAFHVDNEKTHDSRDCDTCEDYEHVFRGIPVPILH